MKLASEEALSAVLDYTTIVPVRIKGFSGLGLEDYIGENDNLQRVGWWEEGMSLWDAISPEHREEVLPEDPAFQKFINTRPITDRETYTYCVYVDAIKDGHAVQYKRLFNSSSCMLENAELVVPHMSGKEVSEANEAARRASLLK